MADFPGAVYDPREKENKASVVYNPAKKTILFVEDITKLEDEVVAIETNIIETSRVRVFLDTANQEIPASEETKVLFNAKSFDTNTEFDIVTNHRFVAKKAGYYKVNAEIHWVDTVNLKTYEIRIKKNGSVIDHSTVVAAGAGEKTTRCNDLVYLAVGNYIEIFVYHNAVSSAYITFGTTHNHLVIAKQIG